MFAALKILSCKYVLLILFTIILKSNLSAQADISEVSIKVGIIRNFQEAIGENSYNAYTLFPELELGGSFFLNHIRWGIGLGIWDNKVDPNIFRDYIPNAYRSFVITPKLYYSFQTALKVPAGFTTAVFAGISYQTVTITPLSSHDILGNKLFKNDDIIIEPLLGAQFGYSFSRKIKISGELGYHFMSRNEYEITQVELKILISYIFI